MTASTFSSTAAAIAAGIGGSGTHTGHDVRRWVGPALGVLTMGVLLGVVVGAAAEQPDPKRFAAQALALRTAAIERSDAATKILATIPGSAPAEVLPGLWHSFFENAIVKLGRLRAPVPVALYYNPLLDIALITFWEKQDGRYRVALIHARQGERLADPTATTLDQPAWMVADDPIATLARVTATRLDTFRRAHPAEAQDAAGRWRRDVRRGRREHARGPAAPAVERGHPDAVDRGDGTLAVSGALAQIDQALAARTATALTAAAPDTDTTVADAIAGLPTAFAAHLTLDMVLPAGNEKAPADRVHARRWRRVSLRPVPDGRRGLCPSPLHVIVLIRIFISRSNRHDRETTTLHHRRTVLHAAGEPVCDASANRGRAFGQGQNGHTELGECPIDQSHR